jgi:putative redox protein
LKRVADRCPLHKLMTQVEVSIETQLSQGPFSQ